MRTILTGLAVAAMAMAGCQSAPETNEPGVCRPEAATALTGRDRITDATARDLTGASLVRQIRPGDAVTMDYRPERVTIETDTATNRITRSMCG